MTRRTGSAQAAARWVDRLLLVGGLFFLLSSCTRTTVALSTPDVQPTASSVPSATPGEPIPVDPDPTDYAVVWVAKNEQLAVRETAGISSPEVGQLNAQSGAVRLTGESTMLGSSKWVEVTTLTQLRGWVPFFNLTEAVPSTGFCQDPRPVKVLEALQASIEHSDAGSLAAILSPRRGLIIRHDPWNPEIRIPLDQVAGIFVDPREFDWGTRFGSETAIRGSFSEVIVPALRDTFEGQTITACNEVLVGSTADSVEWPTPYENLNFYSIYRPASRGGNPFNWRSWLIGFEYVDGQPTIAVMLEVRPQV